MAYPKADFVALNVAVLLKRSGKTRARISDKTIRLFSKRKKLHDVFRIDVRRALEDLGVMAIPLDRGGYAVIAGSALEGAPPITAKQYMSDRKTLTEDDLWDALDLPGTEEEE